MALSFVQTGSSVMNVSLGSPIEVDWELLEVRLHLNSSATGTNPFSITLNSSGNTTSPLNCVLESTSLATKTDFYYRPTIPIPFNGKDKLVFAWLNDASSYKTWGLEAKYR